MQELKTEETIEKLKDMIIDFGDGLLEFETRDVNVLLNQLTLQENYNDMLVTECENLKSEVVVLEEWRDRHEENAVKQFERIKELEAEIDRMQEHLMHNEAELIPLRKENKDLHFKNDLLEDICLTHQNLTQWIEEQIDEVEPRFFKVEDNFIETLFDEIININQKPYTQAGRV